MSENKALIQQLAHCEKHEFDEIVKSYLKEVYKLPCVVVTDGKNDGGIDMKVLNDSRVKLQYQVTIQKSSNSIEKNNLKNKIIEDVVKAKRNVEHFGYAPRLEFYYSYQLTEQFIEELQNNSFSDYGVTLIIIDAKRIAAQATKYPNLYKTILEQSGYNKLKVKSEEISEKDKMFYDLVGFGEAADVKLKIVEAYLLQCLFDNGSMPKEKLVELCMTKFKSSENMHFYNKLLTRMYSQEKRLVYNKKTKEYSLAKGEWENISAATEKIELDESLFLSKIKEVLDAYEQGDCLTDYVNLLYALYIKNIQQRVGQANSFGIEDTESILHYTTQNLKDEVLAKKLVAELVNICDENKFIQKNCAGKVFSSTVDIDVLQSYANSKKRIFVDTTLALHMLCYYNYEATDYNNYYYILSCSLHDFCKKNKLRLYLTEPYFKEVVHHVLEAMNLRAYMQIPGIEKLGGSKNVFYNFYLYLKHTNKKAESYGEYLDYMKFKFYPIEDTLYQEIEFQLKNVGIDVVSIDKTYNIVNAKHLIEVELIDTGRNKSSFGLNHDALMITYLGDNDVSVHPVDPIFLTWDRTLFTVTKAYLEKNPLSQRWMQFTPSQFIDRYSLLSFSINEETISKEMLAMLSGDIEEKTSSLLDSLTLILNPSDQTGRKYIDEFTKMKDEKIYMTTRKSDAPQEDLMDDSLDSLINYLTSHYKKKEGGLRSLRSLFGRSELVDSVIDLIAENLQNYMTYERFMDDMFLKFDLLIKNIKDNNI